MAKKLTELVCALPGCNFKCDTDLTYGGQLRQLKRHWRENEFRFKWYQWDYDEEERQAQMETGVTIITTLWTELDQITGPALKANAEFNAWVNDESTKGPWENAAQMEAEKLKRQLELAKKFGTGRGLAIALKHMSTPYFDNADEVVKHAVARAQAREAGQPIFTPGTGNGPEADRAWLDAKRNGQPLPLPDPTRAPAADAPDFGHAPALSPAPSATEQTPTTSTAPAPAISNAPQPPASVAPQEIATPTPPAAAASTQMFGLDEATVAGIKGAMAQGFGAERIAPLYNLTVEQVNQLVA